jgi:hypothetical protein
VRVKEPEVLADVIPIVSCSYDDADADADVDGAPPNGRQGAVFTKYTRPFSESIGSFELLG